MPRGVAAAIVYMQFQRPAIRALLPSAMALSFRPPIAVYALLRLATPRLRRLCLLGTQAVPAGTR